MLYKMQLLFCAFLLIGFSTMAQVLFTVKAPNRVSQGDKFDVIFVLRNTEGNNFQEPKVDGFTKMYGPMYSSSYSSSWGKNGKLLITSSEEYLLVYRADKIGTYNILAATIEAEGKQYSTSSLTIEVLPQDKSNQQKSSQTQGVRVDDIDTQSTYFHNNKINLDDILGEEQHPVFQPENFKSNYNPYRATSSRSTLGNLIDNVTEDDATIGNIEAALEAGKTVEDLRAANQSTLDMWGNSLGLLIGSIIILVILWMKFKIKK